MVNLLFAVISLTLFAALTSLSISYIPFDAMQRHTLHKELTAGVEQLQDAAGRYAVLHRDVMGKVQYPGAGVDMLTEMSPTYGFTPADPGRGTYGWESRTGYVYGMEAMYLCVLPKRTLTENEKSVLTLLHASGAVGSVFRGVACGAQTDNPSGSYLTYWVIFSHYDAPPPNPQQPSP